MVGRALTRPTRPNTWKKIRNAFIGVVVVAVVVTVGLNYQINQNRDAVRQLHKLAIEQQQFRVARSKLTSRTDLLICKAVNGLKRSERERDNRDFRNLDRNLRLLHIAKTPEIVRAATKDHRQNLARTRPIDCTNLPTQTTKRKPKKHPATRVR